MFTVKGQRVSILGFMVHSVSVLTTWLYFVVRKQPLVILKIPKGMGVILFQLNCIYKNKWPIIWQSLP